LEEKKKQNYRLGKDRDYIWTDLGRVKDTAQQQDKKAKKEAKEAAKRAKLESAKRERLAASSAGATNTAAIAAHRKRNLIGAKAPFTERGRKISNIKEEPIIAEKSLFNKIYNKIKDAPADIKRPSGNVPAKRKEPKGQSHGAQSTSERERGIIEQQADPKLHYTTPHSMDRNRVTAPHEYLDEDQHEFFDDDYRGYVRGRRPYESMIKPNATLTDPRKRKSLFSKIYANISKKN